jgi:uncharacterized membrane protein YgcG
MSAKRTAIFNHGRGKQRGVALIIMLVILVVGIAAVLINSLTSSKVKIARQETTAAALAQAKDALIGRAIADASSPGSLPCPDTDNSGYAQSTVGTPGNNCPSYIGRLPWKSLGLPDLRDGSGERLWYVLSPSFRDYANLLTPATSNPINNNSKGTLLVYDNSGTTLLTPPGSEAVAIIFAPGDVVTSQQRDTANQNSPQNYLDIGPNGINNASASGPFIAADKTNSFNDSLMIIRARDIIPAVEMRVANELSTAFTAPITGYLAKHSNKYPYPANFASCTSASCPSDPTQCIGKIPATDLATFLPTWFTPNNWFDVIYYTAGTSSLPGGAGGGGGGGGKKGKGKKGGGGGGGGGGGSPGCTPFLSILDANGNPLTANASALFLMPDTPLGSITRTSPGLSLINLTDYFEDAENQNLDNLYIMPTAISNDSLYILP